jgi:hypothetical protein
MPLQPKSGKEFFGFSPKVQKHATKKKKKKSSTKRKRRMGKNQRANATRKERESERVRE